MLRVANKRSTPHPQFAKRIMFACHEGPQSAGKLVKRGENRNENVPLGLKCSCEQTEDKGRIRAEF